MDLNYRFLLLFEGTFQCESRRPDSEHRPTQHTVYISFIRVIVAFHRRIVTFDFGRDPPAACRLPLTYTLPSFIGTLVLTPNFAQFLPLFPLLLINADIILYALIPLHHFLVYEGCIFLRCSHEKVDLLKVVVDAEGLIVHSALGGPSSVQEVVAGQHAVQGALSARREEDQRGHGGLCHGG